jgi:excisionase family DNA binding protein
MDELMTYKQLSELLNTPLGTLYALVSQHRIPHVRLGRRFVRFSRTAINTWLAEQTIGPLPTSQARNTDR